MWRKSWEVAESSRFSDLEARIYKLLNTGEVTGAINERMNNMEEESQGCCIWPTATPNS
jgi:hypothetical protein